jgi:hypothetical protein
MADDDSGKTTKATPLQGATAWVLGVAGFIAAITVLATNSESLLAIFRPSKPLSEASSGPVSPAPSDRPDPAVFSNGDTIFRGTWLFDLDNGVVATNRADADLFWEQETDIKRTLNPMNGALFALVGQRDFDSLKLQTLKNSIICLVTFELTTMCRMPFRAAQFWLIKPSVVDTENSS